MIKVKNSRGIRLWLPLCIVASYMAMTGNTADKDIPVNMGLSFMKYPAKNPAKQNMILTGQVKLLRSHSERKYSPFGGKGFDWNILPAKIIVMPANINNKYFNAEGIFILLPFKVQHFANKA